MFYGLKIDSFWIEVKSRCISSCHPNVIMFDRKSLNFICSIFEKLIKLSLLPINSNNTGHPNLEIVTRKTTDCYIFFYYCVYEIRFYSCFTIHLVTFFPSKNKKIKDFLQIFGFRFCDNERHFH